MNLRMYRKPPQRTQRKACRDPLPVIAPLRIAWQSLAFPSHGRHGPERRSRLYLSTSFSDVNPPGPIPLSRSKGIAKTELVPSFRASSTTAPQPLPCRTGDQPRQAEGGVPCMCFWEIPVLCACMRVCWTVLFSTLLAEKMTWVPE